MIQLIGFRSAESAAEFALSQGIADSAWTLAGRWQGRDWYSVLIGRYPDRAAAAAAMADLPEPLRRLQPMLRQLPAGSTLVPIGPDRELPTSR